MDITAGETAAIITVVGTALSFLGITGIDAGVVSSAINGVISLITIGSAVWAYIAHKNAVVAAGIR